MELLKIFRKERYFIVYFNAKTETGHSIGDYSFISHDGKFINRDIVVAEIKKEVPNGNIVITGITELNKNDFNNWVENKKQ